MRGMDAGAAVAHWLAICFRRSRCAFVWAARCCRLSALPPTADASAFDDDDDLPITEEAEEVQAAPTDAAAVPTPAAAGRTAAATPAATAAADLDDDEVADLLADDDEFVGAEPVAAVKAKAKAKPIQKKKKAKKGAAPATPAADPSEATIGNVVNAPQSFFQPIGVYEYVGAALVLLYIINYLYGSRANRRVAREWEAAFVPLLQEQFALVGADMDGAAAAAGQPLLQKESESVYKLYASGRRYAESALVTLDLVARQDLISLGLGLADLAQRRDTMTIDVPLDDEACPAMVFALLRKKGAKKAIKGQADLEAITQPKGPRVPALDKYVVLSELGAEVELELLPERVVKMLQRPSVEAHLHSIHVSDQLTVPFSLSNKILRCKFNLPDEWKSRGEESAVEAVQSLTNMAFFMVDRVGEIKLSPAVS